MKNTRNMWIVHSTIIILVLISVSIETHNMIYLYSIDQVSLGLPTMHEKSSSLFGTLVNYYSYFTVLSNIAVMVCSILILRNKNNPYSKKLQIFRLGTLVAIAITCIVFNILLRNSAHIHSLALHVSNELYHVIIPILAFVSWLFVDINRVPIASHRNIFYALMFTMIYAVYIFIHGYFTGFYPYFFIDVAKIGLTATVISVIGIITLFIIIAYAIKGIENLFLYKKTSNF